MNMKSAIGALFVVLPILCATSAQADEYLLLSNVPSELSVDEIRNLVESHGEIRTINCINIKYANQTQRSCYILMWSTENARNVVAGLNGQNHSGRELYAKEIYPLPCLKDLEMT